MNVIALNINKTHPVVFGMSLNKLISDQLFND